MDKPSDLSKNVTLPSFVAIFDTARFLSHDIYFFVSYNLLKIQKHLPDRQMQKYERKERFTMANMKTSMQNFAINQALKYIEGDPRRY